MKSKDPVEEVVLLFALQKNIKKILVEEVALLFMNKSIQFNCHNGFCYRYY